MPRRMYVPLDQPPMNRPPPPLVAGRSTEQHVREHVIKYQRRRTLLEREGRDAICSRSFCGQSSLDHITEGDILEALRGEVGMLDTASSAIEFETVIENIDRPDEAGNDRCGKDT